MNKRLRAEIREIADHCVIAMGDIFWDRNSYPDADQYADPFETASDCVAQALEDFARRYNIRRPMKSTRT